jgi:hypothetical protein
MLKKRHNSLNQTSCEAGPPVLSPWSPGNFAPGAGPKTKERQYSFLRMLPLFCRLALLQSLKGIVIALPLPGWWKCPGWGRGQCVWAETP